MPDLDLNNMAMRAGWLEQHLRDVQARISHAHNLPAREDRARMFYRIDRNISEALAQIDAANAVTRRQIDACRAAGPTKR